MPTNVAPTSRLLAVRGILSPARRALRLLFARFPPQQQKLAAAAVRAAAARWPQIARLLGVLPGAPVEAHAPPAVDAVAAWASAPAVPPPAAVSVHASIVQLRASADYVERIEAARALANAIDEESTAALVAALRDPSSEVAAQAAESLARHPGDVATTALRTVVDNREGFFNQMTRASAVRALGALLPAHEGNAVAMAVADVDALVSLAAIAALAERDESESAGALMSVLENNAGFYLPLTRQAAARALIRLQNYEPGRLLRLLETEVDATVRETLASLAN